MNGASPEIKADAEANKAVNDRIQELKRSEAMLGLTDPDQAMENARQRAKDNVVNLRGKQVKYPLASETRSLHAARLAQSVKKTSSMNDLSVIQGRSLARSEATIHVCAQLVYKDPIKGQFTNTGHTKQIGFPPHKSAFDCFDDLIKILVHLQTQEYECAQTYVDPPPLLSWYVLTIL